MKIEGIPGADLLDVDFESNNPPLAQDIQTYLMGIKLTQPDSIAGAVPYSNMEVFIGIETNDDIEFSLPDQSPFTFTRIDSSLTDLLRQRLSGKFGQDLISRCSEDVWKCGTVAFGDGFTFETEIKVDSLPPGFTSLSIVAAADNSKRETEEDTVGVLTKDKKLPVFTVEELGEAIDLFNDDSLFTDKTIGLVADSIGVREPVPPALRTYFFDEFESFRRLGLESFRKTGSQAPVTVDFAGCVPDPTAGLFCGFVFQAPGGGIRNLRIQNAPVAAVDASADSIFVSSNEFVDNAVGVQVSSGIGTTIRGNTFSGNGQGIDLGGDGVTDNDDGDSDDGPNNLQNYPVLTDALLGGSSTITGTFNSAPDATFLLEFFASQTGECGEDGRNGERLLGTADVATDADGNAAFTVVLDSTVARMDYVTATATDAGGNTSELSACVQVVTGVATEGPAEVPTEFALDQNYPNPFNPATTITYAVPQASRVRLEVFDLLGRLVVVLVDEMKAAGSYKIVFDASRLSSGVYFYKMTGERFSQTKSLMLLK